MCGIRARAALYSVIYLVPYMVCLFHWVGLKTPYGTQNIAGFAHLRNYNNIALLFNMSTCNGYIELLTQVCKLCAHEEDANVITMNRKRIFQTVHCAPTDRPA